MDSTTAAALMDEFHALIPGLPNAPRHEVFQKLRKELDLHDPKLSERPWIVVANKMDLPEAAEKLEHFRGRYPKLEIFPVSAESREGIEAFKLRLGVLVSELASPLRPAGEVESAEAP